MPLYNPNQGGVTNVTANLPLISSGGATPDISIAIQPDGLYAISFSSGVASLTTSPIFLDETSTFDDIVPNRLHIYIGNAPLTIDLDVVIPYPLPVPTQQNFSIINDSGFSLDIVSNAGNSGLSLAARYSYANAITIFDGGGYWEVTPLVVRQAPTFQQVLSVGNTVQNLDAVFTDFLANETRFYYDGFFAKNLITLEEMWYSNRFIRKEASGLKTWVLDYPDLTANANSSSYNVGFRPNVNGIVAYLEDIVTGAVIEQTTIDSATVTIGNNTTVLYVNPTTTLATLTITMPSSPSNGQEVKVSFGGTITLGSVATVLAIVGNTGQSILGGVSITDADAGDGYIFKFQSSLGLWRLF